MSVTINRYKSYLAMIEHAPGTEMFRTVIADVDGIEQDILRDGNVSCAYFVSSVLLLHGLIERVHATVESTTRDMQMSGWEKIARPRAGAVVVWKSRDYPDGEQHAHNGFVVGEDEAVSTDYEKKEVVRHAMTELNGPREIDAFFWHPMLDAGA